MSDREPDSDQAEQRVVADLLDEFPNLDHDHVSAVAQHEFESLVVTSKAPAFVGILSERHAREVLQNEQRLLESEDVADPRE